MSCTSAGGVYSLNTKRSLLSRAKNDLGMTLTPIVLHISRYIRRRNDVGVSGASLLAPREIVVEIFRSNKGQFLWGDSSQWSRFWHLMREEKWFTEHSYAEGIRAQPHSFASALLHSDAAPVSRRVRRNFRAVNMYSPFLAHCVDASCGYFQFPIYANDVAWSPARKEAFDEVVAWSFKVGASNIWVDFAGALACLGFGKRRAAFSA